LNYPTYYLKIRNPRRQAWITNPTPIVIIFNISFEIKALKNINNNPDQINATTSIEGSLSETPRIRPNNGGMVALCIRTTASHPTTSVEILAI
jgi:hypothetical protein